MAILPNEEQIAALLENDQGGPINMLNLLKFKEFAEYEAIHVHRDAGLAHQLLVQC